MSAHLDRLIEEAMSTQEIKKWVEELELDRTDLRAVVAKSADQIWRAAAKEIAEVNVLEMQIERLQREVAASPPPKLLAGLGKLKRAMPPPLSYIVALLVRLLDWTYPRRRSRVLSQQKAESGMRELLERLEAARRQADESVKDLGILPHLRGIINEAIRKQKA
jgi:hypothetical protein